MARFNFEQLERAKKLIKNYVSEDECKTFNAKIPLCVLQHEDKLDRVKQFHEKLMNLCEDLFKDFKFKTAPLRIFASHCTKPALFVIWLQDKMPKIVKFCLKSMKIKDFKLVVITEKNVEKYISIPDKIKQAYQNNCICSADYSDYIRIKLLEKYRGIYFDATTLIRNQIPDYVYKKPYWSVKGDYQKNTSPVAMLHYEFGQVYALGGWDNTIYSYVRQLLDYYYSKYDYCFSYYMSYYVFEYVYRHDTMIKFDINHMTNNNEDCEQVAYELDLIGKNKLNAKDFQYKDTFFYKLRSSDEYNKYHYKFFKDIKN